jgi:hypothetical protein
MSVFATRRLARSAYGVEGVRASNDKVPNPSDVILFLDRHWAGANKGKFAKVIEELKGTGLGFGQINKQGRCG